MSCSAKHRILVIKFFTKTCPPCKAIAPKFEALAKELSSLAFFLSIDAQVYGLISNNQFRVLSVPNFVVLAQGKQPVSCGNNLATVRTTVETFAKELA